MIAEKTYRFSVRIVKLSQYLQQEHHEYVLSKQVLRSGTSIAANVVEAKQGQSRPDFSAKYSIALKEAAETEYWLRLLYDTGYLSDKGYRSIQNDCAEINRILTAIVKSAKTNRKADS